MKYKTPAAFRQALEARLREQSQQTNVPLTRLRKMIAFDRFLARLTERASDSWIIKGGLALQLRLGDVARTTKDIDAGITQQLRRDEAIARFRKAASLDLKDWFEFEVGEPTEAVTGAPQGGFRFPVRCFLDGRNFETFHLDLGLGDPVVDKPEKLTSPALLSFAGIRPSTVPCCPLTTQIAEKLHAYTRPYAGGGSSRVRDLIDILLIALIGAVNNRKLSHALKVTFEARNTHKLPKAVTKPPASWSAPYKKLVRELNLGWSTSDEAWEAAARFLNPVLDGTANGTWHPTAWAWK